MMELPDGKLPGFYAQIIKGIANKAEVFDRDKELLIANSEIDRNAMIEVLDRYKVSYEKIDLLYLPEQTAMRDTFYDYGFESKFGNLYLYTSLVSLFCLTDDASSQSEYTQAMIQIEEHLIANFEYDGNICYVVDRLLEELMRGIVKAYHINLSFLTLSTI